MRKVTMWVCFVLLGNLIAAFPTGAQPEGAIKGSVKDAETGEGLPGVNVIIAGTTRGHGDVWRRLSRR